MGAGRGLYPGAGPPTGMPIVVLTALTMCAFAGNSILNRLGVAEAGTDPMVFALIRVAAGAGVLAVLLRMRAGPRAQRPVPWGGAMSLALYMVGFSWAYLSLAAGLGALILFGVVQLVMFAVAVATGQAVPPLRWIGAGVAFAGLVVLLWPAGDLQVPFLGAASMAAAGAAWAFYTLLGQRAEDALAASTASFLWCLPLTAMAALMLGDLGAVTLSGALLASLAGAVTSGLGYALWYRVLPGLTVTQAAVAQLTVPVIAILGGSALLGEALTWRVAFASLLTLGGVALALRRGT